MMQRAASVLGRLDMHSREVLSGAALAFVLRAVGAGLAFALNVVIGRLLGAEGAGLYFMALSVVTIGAVITKLGLDNTLLRFIASGASSGDWSRVLGVFRMGMRLAAGARALRRRGWSSRWPRGWPSMSLASRHSHRRCGS